jgi:hypothetical protein
MVEACRLCHAASPDSGDGTLASIHDERIKLTANWLNIISAGCIITGVVAPAVAVIYGTYGQSRPGLWLMVASSAIWLFAGLNLHWIGRRLLKRLT